MGMIEILSPVSAPRIDEVPLASRRRSLDGLTVGVFDNGKANAERLVGAVAAELGARGATFESVYEHKMATLPAPDEVMGRLQRCDAVVLAIAD
ncbi:MAG: hypothetical protein GY929_08870 [Actinomycetia bacterium]|nr:hypothetical protein [Actinomycetes bacterium]